MSVLILSISFFYATECKLIVLVLIDYCQQSGILVNRVCVCVYNDHNIIIIIIIISTLSAWPRLRPIHNNYYSYARCRGCIAFALTLVGVQRNAEMILSYLVKKKT